jgi:hypothetical protein
VLPACWRRQLADSWLQLPNLLQQACYAVLLCCGQAEPMQDPQARSRPREDLYTTNKTHFIPIHPHSLRISQPVSIYCAARVLSSLIAARQLYMDDICVQLIICRVCMYHTTTWLDV